MDYLQRLYKESKKDIKVKVIDRVGVVSLGTSYSDCVQYGTCKNNK